MLVSGILFRSVYRFLVECTSPSNVTLPVVNHSNVVVSLGKLSLLQSQYLVWLSILPILLHSLKEELECLSKIRLTGGTLLQMHHREIEISLNILWIDS